jgi:SiaC family regulatory phosphoprotein
MLLIIKEQSADKPLVAFDEVKNTFILQGKSYPEDAYRFYEEVEDILGAYLKQKKSLIFSCELTYINSTSSRAIFDLFNTLKNKIDKHENIKVIWRYHEENHNMKEMGEDLQEDLESLKIKLVPIK